MKMPRIFIAFIIFLQLSCSKNSWIEETLVDPDNEFGTFTPSIAIKAGSYKIMNDTLYAEFDVFACQFINDHDYKDHGFYLPYANPSPILNDFAKIREFDVGTITRSAYKSTAYSAAKSLPKAESIYVVVDMTGSYREMFKERIRPYLNTIAKGPYQRISLILIQRQQGKYFSTLHDLKGNLAGQAINQLDNPALKTDSICLYESMDHAIDFIVADKNTTALIDLMYIENVNLNSYCGATSNSELLALGNKMKASNIRFSATDIYGSNNYTEYSYLSSVTGGIHIPSFEPAMFADPNNIYLKQLFDPAFYQRMQVKYKLKNYVIDGPVFLDHTYSELDGYKISNYIFCLPE